MEKNPVLAVDNFGFIIKGIQQYSPREAYEKCLKGCLLLDVRSLSLSSFKAFDVPDVLFCPWRNLEDNYKAIPTDREIIVADAAGVNGMDVIRTLQHKGFFLLANLAGGLVEWERDGLPIAMDSRERLTGSCVCQLRPRERSKK